MNLAANISTDSVVDDHINLSASNQMAQTEPGDSVVGKKIKPKGGCAIGTLNQWNISFFLF